MATGSNVGGKAAVSDQRPRYSALERHGQMLPGETPTRALIRANNLDIIAAELVEHGAVYSGELLASVAQAIRAEVRSLEAARPPADYLPCDTEASSG